MSKGVKPGFVYYLLSGLTSIPDPCFPGVSPCRHFNTGADHPLLLITIEHRNGHFILSRPENPSPTGVKQGICRQGP